MAKSEKWPVHRFTALLRHRVEHPATFTGYTLKISSSLALNGLPCCSGPGHVLAYC